MLNSEFNNKNKILAAIRSFLSNKKKTPHPLEWWNSQTEIIKKTKPTKTFDLKELNKQFFFSLTPLHRNRTESLLTDSSTAYLNTVHPTKLRVNLNEAPSTKRQSQKRGRSQSLKTTKKKQQKKSGLRSASRLHLRGGAEKQKSKTSNVISEYLKTFSKNRTRKPGVLINYNQQIAYNFNIKNVSLSLLLKRVEYLIKNPLKKKIQNIQDLSKKEKKDLVLFHKSILTLPKYIPIQPRLRGGAKKQMIEKTHITETATAPHPMMKATRVHREIPQDLQLRLKSLNRIKRLKDVSIETVYNRNVNKKLIKYSYNLLFYFFKSMYCLISKPVFLFTPDKVVIQLLYFLNIPKFKVFKWYSIFRNKLNRKKRAARKKQIQSLEKVKFNVRSVADKAPGLNQIEKFSSSHTFKSDVRKRKRIRKYKYRKKKKIYWKVARTLIRLMKKRTKVQNILFNLFKYNLFRVFSLKFKLICEILNNKFKKQVELQLIRVHKPYLDSNILGNLLSVNIRNKKFKPNVKIAKLFQKIVVKNVSDLKNQSVNFKPSYLSGIQIRIGGRLMREFVIPRRTTRIFERGARSIGKVNYLDTSSITNVNKKGSYTMKISTGQNFF